MKQNRNNCLFKLNSFLKKDALFNTEEHKLLNKYWFPMDSNMQLGCTISKVTSFGLDSPECKPQERQDFQTHHDKPQGPTQPAL
jgi:hypothetical protein